MSELCNQQTLVDQWWWSGMAQSSCCPFLASTADTWSYCPPWRWSPSQWTGASPATPTSRSQPQSLGGALWGDTQSHYKYYTKLPYLDIYV